MVSAQPIWLSQSLHGVTIRSDVFSTRFTRSKTQLELYSNLARPTTTQAFVSQTQFETTLLSSPLLLLLLLLLLLPSFSSLGR